LGRTEVLHASILSRTSQLPVAAKQMEVSGADAIEMASSDKGSSLGQSLVGFPPDLLVEGQQSSQAPTLLETCQEVVLRTQSCLPVLLRFKYSWHLCYSTTIHGISLQTLYRRVEDAGPCLLVIEDANACVFGAFASDGLKPRHGCHGDSDTFVFACSPEAGRCRIFHCAANASITHSDHKGIVVGIDGPALSIEEDMLRGSSKSSVMFNSPPLTLAGTDFVISRLEVWYWQD